MSELHQGVWKHDCCKSFGDNRRLDYINFNCMGTGLYDFNTSHSNFIDALDPGCDTHVAQWILLSQGPLWRRERNLYSVVELP